MEHSCCVFHSLITCSFGRLFMMWPMKRASIMWSSGSVKLTAMPVIMLTSFWLETRVIWQQIELSHMIQLKYKFDICHIFFLLRKYFLVCLCVSVFVFTSDNVHAYAPEHLTLFFLSIAGICRSNWHTFYGNKCKGCYKCGRSIHGHGCCHQG